MNHGVLFDNGTLRKHSADDWGLIFNPFDIPFPQPKTDLVEIEGGNGSIDLTESYGRIYYKDNSFTMTFTCTDKVKYDWVIDEISSFIHGQRLKLFPYFDEFWYYDARVEINKYACDKTLGTITLNIVANPYRLKNVKTISIFDVTESEIVNMKNARMETVPTFKCDTDFIVIHNGNSYAINGTVIIPEIEFQKGDNFLELQGNGVIEISYQEGKF